MSQLDDKILQPLIARFTQPGVIGIAMAGSYSRGGQDKYSDIDLDIFVNDLPGDDYTLRIFDGKLLSIKYIRPADELDSLTRPERAVWSVNGLRNMILLADPNGDLAALKKNAEDFKWEPLQPAADKYAVEQLAGCSEEAHKIMSGLEQDLESKVTYAAWGMFKGLSFAALVQAGLLIQTENLVFSQIEDHFGSAHPWTRAFRLSFGMDVKPVTPAYVTRGVASLDLYEETHRLFTAIIGETHREVIENTLQLISDFKKTRLKINEQ